MCGPAHMASATANRLLFGTRWKVTTNTREYLTVQTHHDTRCLHSCTQTDRQIHTRVALSDGEMAQLATCLLHHHENLDLIPRTHVKSQAEGCAPAKKEGPLGLADLGKSVSFQVYSARNPASECVARPKMPPDFELWPPLGQAVCTDKERISPKQSTRYICPVKNSGFWREFKGQPCPRRARWASSQPLARPAHFLETQVLTQLRTKGIDYSENSKDGQHTFLTLQRPQGVP